MRRRPTSAASTPATVIFIAELAKETKGPHNSPHYGRRHSFEINRGLGYLRALDMDYDCTLMESAMDSDIASMTIA
jgi:hypothetical protein